MLASDSKDGEYIARGIRAFGHSTVRGSSSRGTTKATRGLLRALQRKHNVSITPDGPRGPRYKAQPGALWVSVMADSPIVPIILKLAGNGKLIAGIVIKFLSRLVRCTYVWGSHGGFHVLN